MPWESAFRIAKRVCTPDTAACPRWPDEFWDDALTRGGGGGACFRFSPLYSIAYNSTVPTQRTSPFRTYTVRPNGEGKYQIERMQHPQPNCFTLIDTPVSDGAYRAALAVTTS